MWRRRRDTSNLREETIGDRSIGEEKSIANSVMLVFIRSSVQILSRVGVDSAESSLDRAWQDEKSHSYFFFELWRRYWSWLSQNSAESAESTWYHELNQPNRPSLIESGPIPGLKFKPNPKERKRSRKTQQLHSRSRALSSFSWPVATAVRLAACLCPAELTLSFWFTSLSIFLFSDLSLTRSLSHPISLFYAISRSLSHQIFSLLCSLTISLAPNLFFSLSRSFSHPIFSTLPQSLSPDLYSLLSPDLFSLFSSLSPP